MKSNLFSLHKELETEKKRLEKALNSRSIFIADISHEIRTPINAIIGMNFQLLESIYDQEQVKKLKIIESSSELLLSIVNDVLDFSKLDKGNIVLEKIPINIFHLIEEILEMQKGPAKEKGILIKNYIDKKIPKWILGDSVRLRQILLNLISNAIKYSEGKNIEIYATSYQLEKTHLEVSVKDYGTGISPEKIDQLFQPFYQTDISTTRIYGGTGLGLSISKTLLDKMAGKISVKSTLNKGSTFTFNIPIELAKPPNSIISEFENSNNSSIEKFSLRILVVDDNQMNLDIFRTYLKKLGFKEDLAENGIKAVKMTKVTKYDLVFMDCNMPVLDGYEATKQINERDGSTSPLYSSSYG